MRHWRSEEDRLGGLMWGIGLVLIGFVILLQYLDVVPFAWWRHWWPLIIVMVGFSQLVAARSAKRIGSGVSTMLIGGWCFIATNHVWGLSWHNSWPLALVAAGTGMVVRAVAGSFMRRDDVVREVEIDG